MDQVIDAVVVGSGPNGLAAAIELARAGKTVTVMEGAAEPGGGLRSGERTLPGFVHDFCSACHPMGALSAFFRNLPLAEHGLRWKYPSASVAHPLDGQPSVLLKRSLRETARELGADSRAYEKMFSPFVEGPEALLDDLVGPLRWPRHPVRMARFGAWGLLPAKTLFRWRFREARARALLGGCAGHSILPFERPLSGAVGMLFALTGHLVDWPVAEGGSGAIARALVSYFEHLGGRIETGHRITSLKELPPSRVVLLDTSPSQLAHLGRDSLPPGYLRRLRRYRYGPGVFKLDWALDGPIPWSDPRTLEASTVHVGGTLEELASAEAEVWKGRHPDKPFVMVVQQSQLDATRAPQGKHTGYAYCHVPAGSDVDLTDVVGEPDRALCPRLSGPYPGAAPNPDRGLRERQSQLHRRCDHWRRCRPRSVLYAPRGPTRSLLDAGPEALSLLGLDTTRGRRTRYVRFSSPRGARSLGWLEIETVWRDTARPAHCCGACPLSTRARSTTGHSAACIFACPPLWGWGSRGPHVSSSVKGS